MARRLAIVLLLVAACGKKKDPLPPMPPDPDSKQEAKKPPPVDEKPAEAKPAKPPGPIDATIAAPKVTVKLVSAGKGKKAPIKVTPKSGGKQAVELAIDFSQRAEQGTEKQGGMVLTFVFTGDAEVKDVDKNGAATYGFVVTGTDARAGGTTLPADKLAGMKSELAVLKGLQIGSTIAANGIAGDLKLHLDNGDDRTKAAIEVFQIALPAWPILPAEPIGVGAKWQVVISTKTVQAPIDVTQTTDYELVKHDGATWTIKGTTKVTGGDQVFGPTQVTKITGTGAVEVALVDGALYPTMKATVSTDFVASQGTESATIGITQGTTITPK